MAEIQEEQHQHRGQPRVPHPPGAPHRLAPDAAGEQAQRGEAGADRSDLGRRQVGQRMPPDQRQHRAHGQRQVAGRGQPGRGHMHVHDPHRVALLPVGRREEQAPDQADARSTPRRPTASHGSTAPDRRRKRPGLAKRCRVRPGFRSSGARQRRNLRPRGQPIPCRAFEGSRYGTAGYRSRVRP